MKIKVLPPCSLRSSPLPAPTVGPESRGEIMMMDLEKKDETQLDQQMNQQQVLPVHPKASNELSGKQLALRRGLLLLGVIAVLVGGILVRVYVRVE